KKEAKTSSLRIFEGLDSTKKGGSTSSKSGCENKYPRGLVHKTKRAILSHYFYSTIPEQNKTHFVQTLFCSIRNSHDKKCCMTIEGRLYPLHHDQSFIAVDDVIALPLLAL